MTIKKILKKFVITCNFLCHLILEEMETKSCKKVASYFCEKCDYNTCRKSSWDKHIVTTKHSLSHNGNQKLQKSCRSTQQFLCDTCSAVYNTRNGLWKHKQKCNGDKIKTNISDTIETNTMMQIIQQNEDFKALLIEQNDEFKTLLVEQNTKVADLCEVMKNNTNTITNNTMMNSNNKSFNLNVFLNETCKDAMNMKDFVDSIQITLTDIENMGKLGFVNGISNIIVNRLKAIDVHLRPVHCTDQRRETMYVKEKNQWNKEEHDNKNIRRFIQLVAHKNTKNLSLFKNKHPDCLEYHSKYNDQYNKIVMETFGGYGNTDYDSENKIIRKLVKELAIDKSM